MLRQIAKSAWIFPGMEYIQLMKIARLLMFLWTKIPWIFWQILSKRIKLADQATIRGFILRVFDQIHEMTIFFGKAWAKTCAKNLANIELKLEHFC